MSAIPSPMPLTRRQFLATVAASSAALPLLRPSVALAGGRSLTVLTVGDSALKVVLPGTIAPSSAAVLAWVQRAGDCVARWYGRFPVPTVWIEFGNTPFTGISNGVTYGGSDPNIHISIGRHTTQADLDTDWVLVHEMTHLAFPNVAPEHHWIEEGIATYVEPWERVEAGILDVGTAWHDFIVGVPQGQPAAGDEGLDHTHTWGRTYWGGALFCLVADVAVLDATSGRVGLKAALLAIRDDTGGIQHAEMPIEDVLAIGDKAIGTPVIGPLYEKMKAAPAPVDLDALWSKLGVKVSGETVTVDDKAECACWRQAIARVPGHDLPSGPAGE